MQEKCKETSIDIEQKDDKIVSNYDDIMGG